MSILTATVAKVPFGTFEIDGLLLADGNFAIAVPQIGVFLLNQDIQNTTARDLKRLLAKDSKTSQIEFISCKTEFNKNKTLAVSLLDFERLLLELTIQGNSTAIALTRSLIGLSLTQVFSDAFNIKFEKEDRQAFLVQRQTHKTAFHPLYTSWLQKDGVTAYGTEVNKLKLAVGLPLVFCGDYDYAQLSKLNRAEGAYDCLRKAGLNHQRALEILDI